MAVLTRLGHTDLPRISHCRSDGQCKEVRGNVARVPWLRDETRPFPLVGEGVGLEDVAGVLEVQLESAMGYLELEASEVLAYGSSHPKKLLDGLSWEAGE